MSKYNTISLKKVSVHNLKDVDLTLDKNTLIVFTGVSGSGKSSMAFDTIYAEGQRRYLESLSVFARRQIGGLAKPDIGEGSGLSPTISIEQKTAGRNPRSTVGTLTEIYDYLRLLYARIGTPHCPISGEPVTPQSKEHIIASIGKLPLKTPIVLLAPYAKGKKGEFREDFQDLVRKGYMRVRVDGNIVDLSDEIILDAAVSHDVDVVIDRMRMGSSEKERLASSVIQALDLGGGVCIVLNSDTKEEMLFSLHAFSQKSGISYRSLEPNDFSFNSPSGMCSRCHGLGTTQEFNLDLIIDPSLSIAEDCCSIASSYQTVRFGNIYRNLSELYHFSLKTPWKKLSSEAKKVFLYGIEKKWTRMNFIHPVTGSHWVDYVQWRGVLYEAHHRFSEAKSEVYRKNMQTLMSMQICPECRGERLKPYPAATLFREKRIAAITAMTVSVCYAFFSKLTLSSQDMIIAEEVVREITERLRFLLEVGLHYLTLDRTAPTLSGGEAQRVRLASQIGCGLVGITYVLDEPSIGLHPRDNKRLIGTMKHLRDMGNTVIVVEHDEETIWEADRVVDFGPKAGIEGGEILVNGTMEDLLKNKDSLTGAYLSGRMEIPIPLKRRKPVKKNILTIVGASHHNLKDVTISIPLGLFVAVTGVSGCGKSSLIIDILYPALSRLLHGGEQPVGNHRGIEGIEAIDKVIAIDQSPIGRTPRSNPATYSKLFDEIRDLFSQLPESIARGYKAGRFSFNVKQGSCTECEGMGQIKVDMDFMEDAYVDCPLCKTRRFDPETLSVLYKGKSIYDVLEMSVIEAIEFFALIPSIRHKLQTLISVGLHYMKLGQSSTTLSGGEAQRIKLAKELIRPSTGKTLYILDEPTTGLHFHDTKHLLEVLHALVDKGNTVLVIEHNMDVVKTADWIIDLGPEGGEEGGQVVAIGNPEQIAILETATGHALSETLFCNRKEKVKNLLKKKKKLPEKQNLSVAVTEMEIEGARQNNLKNITLSIPREKITVCTGPSGSGKSSLAFETIYAEGQRRYVESLSPYARQFIKQMAKPKVDRVSGLSPAIAIEQKAHAGNPRSTIGTMTEIYDYLRILFARIGIPHCPETKEVIRAISKEHVVERILSWTPGVVIHILAPIEPSKSEQFSDLFVRIQRQGYSRIRLNGVFYDVQPQENESAVPSYDRKRKNALYLVIDRLKVQPSSKARLSEAIENGEKVGEGKLVVLRGEEEILFNLAFAVESTGKTYPAITPHSFSFNSEEGMCQVCMGLGVQYGTNFFQNPSVLTLSLSAFMKELWGKSFPSSYPFLEKFLDKEKINPDIPMEELSSAQMQLFLRGMHEEEYLVMDGMRFRWQGIDPVLTKGARSGIQGVREAIQPLLQEQVCLSCRGARINPLARHVTINELAIQDLCALPVEQALDFIRTISLSSQEIKVLGEVYTQIISRMEFLSEVGLHYLSLDRKAPTLSGGEAQRIRLARQLGTGLTGVLYVLDEPTIGLHPADNARLNLSLEKLNALGNTLILVEHDPQTIAIADYIIDFGPGSGKHGGQIMAKGTYKEILRDKKSLTGAYLSGRKKIGSPGFYRPSTKGFISIRGASINNLKSIDVDIPVGLLTCITGVSGSGKSTLIQQVLLPALQQRANRDALFIEGARISGIGRFDAIISIDQNPVGHTVRSDVGTYADVLPKIRDFFANLPAAKAQGLQPGHFSCNHRKGMCTNCWGLGYARVEMQFLPAVNVVCDQCCGMRLNPLSLTVLYQEKSFGQYLEMTIDEARVAFAHHPRITRILDTLIAVGLGYVTLGGETATLSGGEAQRLKLSRELAKRSTGNTLYLLDEPTTGLHSDDIQKLLGVLHRLVDKGNTMIVIEHHVNMIKNADYIIELGPGAGDKGGAIIALGTPQEIAASKTSVTGKYL